MQTFLWSEITTNLSVLSQCFVGDEIDPVTPESLTQFASDPMMRLGGDLDTIRVLSQRFISPTEVLLDVQAKFDERSGVMGVEWGHHRADIAQREWRMEIRCVQCP
ncbi:MAG TPA: hypothetical protein PK236_11390 [Verrucomicrobiota bacterium]|jgi:hypothetical protein|nr:hypothetical protein [Verrucomicrobiota bacterium]